MEILNGPSFLDRSWAEGIDALESFTDRVRSLGSHGIRSAILPTPEEVGHANAQEAWESWMERLAGEHREFWNFTKGGRLEAFLPESRNRHLGTA